MPLLVDPRFGLRLRVMFTQFIACNDPKDEDALCCARGERRKKHFTINIIVSMKNIICSENSVWLFLGFLF